MDSRDPYASHSDDPLGDLARLVGQPDPFVASNPIHPGAEMRGTYDAEVDAVSDEAFFSELESELAVSMAEDADAEEAALDVDLDIDSAYLEEDVEAADESAHYAGMTPGFASAAAAPRAARSSRLVPIAASLLVIAGVGAAGVYGYGAMTGVESGETPLIAADLTPVKRTVEGPSGREIPHQNKLVYERVTGEEPEVEQATLLPQPDQVRDMPSADGPIEPRKVRTVTVRPDGTIVRDGAVPITQPVSAPVDQPISTQQVARAVPVRTITAPNEATREVSEAEATALANFGDARLQPEDTPVAEVAPVEAADQIALLTTEGAEAVATPDSQPVAPVEIAALPLRKPEGLTAPAAPQPEAAPVAETAAPSASGWMVQLTSQRSQEQAQSAFDGLKGRFSSVLGGSQANIARADLGDRGVFYRVRVAAESRAEADQLCGSLKSAGGDCFVQYVN